MPNKIRYSSTPKRPRGDQVEAKAERDKFYSGDRWRRLRRAFLHANPLCVDCMAEGRVNQATTPHHKVERLADPELAYEWANLEPLCNSHHTRRHNGKRPWQR